MILHTIGLTHKQVLEIVVTDLIYKYEHNVNPFNPEWVDAFEKVLSYYLDDGEMAKLNEAIVQGKLPPNPTDLFETETK